jgi:hypothetical protein
MLVGCASSDVRPIKDDPRFTHDLRVDLGLMSNWNDLTAGTDTALRVARKTCGAASNATAEELKLTQGPALYNMRLFKFSCPNSLEEIQ